VRARASAHAQRAHRQPVVLRSRAVP